MQTNTLEVRALRFTALCGLVGAVVLLIADFVLYANFGETSSVSAAIDTLLASRKAILSASPAQLLLSSLLCPLVAVLYVAGSWHVYQRLRPASSTWSAIAGALFALLVVMSCVYHALWSQFGLALQFANQHVEVSGDLFATTSVHMKQSLDAAALVGLPLIVVMTVLILRGRTSFPRWAVAVNPFLLYAIATPLLTPIANHLPVPIGALILSGLSEGLMAVFFLAAMFTLSDDAVDSQKTGN